MVSIPVNFCGLNLKSQCYTIAVIQAATSFALFVLALAMLIHPENFIKNFQQIENDQRLRSIYVSQIGENGIELVIGSVTTFMASICLFQGVKRSFTGLILPWLIITSVDLGATFMVFMMRVTSSESPIRASKILAAILYHLVTLYFLYSVFFYFKLIKRQKKMSAALALQHHDFLSTSTESSLDLRLPDVEGSLTSHNPHQGSISSTSFSNPVATQVQMQHQQQLQNNFNWNRNSPRRINDDPFSDDDDFILYQKP